MVKELKKSKRLYLKSLMFLSTLFTIPLAAFSSEYILKKQEIFDSQMQPMGYIYKGTKVEKIDGKYVLPGWVMDGNEYIVFFSNKERIKLARIDESFIKNFVVKGSMEDDLGVTWKKVELEIVLNKEAKLTSNENSLWTEEKELYLRCGSCHNLHDEKEFTANQWPQIMKTMQNNAGFTKKEAKKVSLFLQYKSLQEK